MTEVRLCDIKIVAVSNYYDHDAVKMPRTRLYAPLTVTFSWVGGAKEIVPLVYTSCSGANRYVLFTNKFAVMLQWLDSSKAGQGWTPNEDEWKMARHLSGFIPDVYGCFDVNIEDHPYSALVVRKVPSTVHVFLGDLMRVPPTRKPLARVLDMLIESVRQMCACAGSEHKCKLASPGLLSGLLPRSLPRDPRRRNTGRTAKAELPRRRARVGAPGTLVTVDPRGATQILQGV